jgi:transcriptional regulator with XRE-family HTH domain
MRNTLFEFDLSNLLLKSDTMQLNEKIKLLRLSKNYTQIYMAEELGIDAANYSRLEKGLVKISTERLAKIAQILSIDIKTLINNSEEEEREIEPNECIVLLKEILKEVQQINSKLK